MSRRWKLGLAVWGAGMLGAVALTFLVLPQLLESMPAHLGVAPPPIPTGMLMAASLVQSAVLLGLATWAGVALGPATGLRAPAFEATVARGSARDALRPQIAPGLVAGILGGVVLAACSRLAPAEVQAAQERFALPLVVRVLYGGITEEVLLRWGFMTVLVWLAWRALGRTRWALWVAVVVSAFVFAAGHLPAAGILVGPLNAAIVGYVLVANTLFGIVFGWLYWRYGLEAAILAHAVTHVVSFLISGAALTSR